MKPGASSLNPYAAAYIPLSKREADGGTCVAGGDYKSYEGPVGFQTPQHTTQDQHRLHPSTRASQKLFTSQAYHVKGQPESSSSGSVAQGAVQMADKQMLDEESDMDLEYLRMTFPGISDQSLIDVYMVNGGDLESAIDMLSQLEFDGVHSSESLPETLDIGDISESGNFADSASLKLKNAAAEAGTSSTPSAPATVS
ncbi:polyadenylate-binding protein-interacting protein 5 [Neltuma alba]|uniref:polyadenylate-binding protein-interacting protein 5 n=1 Tax=Neltuma alba TaxID=207710 RepID=UPI0010A455DE|nr:polyadenylate-binding protein-interacting protein 5-like [Prosopis alba]